LAIIKMAISEKIVLMFRSLIIKNKHTKKALIKR